MTVEREKRMPDAKNSDDVSYGYAWNIGNGVSYMKMQVGKTNNPVQNKVINSLRDGGRSYVQNQNDKTGYEKLHKDFLKMSQQIASQKNKNLFLKPAENQGVFGAGNQPFNFINKNSATIAINNDQNKGIQESHTKLQEFNTKLRQEYDKFNKGVQISGWPQQQGYSLKELNMAQNMKTLPSNGKDNEQYNIEDKPINILELSQGFLKSLESKQNFPFSGNLDGIYKSVELPMHEANRGSDKGMEANFQRINSKENTFKYINEEGRVRETIPQHVNIAEKHNSGINDAVFEYIGETNHKAEGDGERRIPEEFSRSQDGAWSTQNVVSNHQSNIHETENKYEETRKNIDDENVQKINPETPETHQVGIGNQGSTFQINHENQGLENKFPRFFNGMHPSMNQKLINDQVERIKLIQQKVIEDHFPGAGIYDALDGNAQNAFNIQGYLMQPQENIGMWKQGEYNRGSDQNRGRFEHDVQNNREISNIEHNRENPVHNVGTASLSFSNSRFVPVVDQQRHQPFIHNNPHSFNIMQNQFIGGQKLANEESLAGSQDNREDEIHWRPQRYSVKSNNQPSDLQNDTYESQKLKSEDFIKGNDERKGREIKHEGSVSLEHQETHALEDHAKEHFYGSEGHEEVKPSLAGNGYSHYHTYPHQEPQVKVITKAVPVHKELKIPVPQMVRHPILIPVPYKVLEPYPIKIPVPVTVEKTVEVPVEKVIHYPVEKLVPKKVVKEVRVPVPKPYPVKVPVYKIKYVHHNKKKHE